LTKAPPDTLQHHFFQPLPKPIDETTPSPKRKPLVDSGSPPNGIFEGFSGSRWSLSWTRAGLSCGFRPAATVQSGIWCLRSRKQRCAAVQEP